MGFFVLKERYLQRDIRAFYWGDALLFSSMLKLLSIYV
jgi:hypothetical protein